MRSTTLNTINYQKRNPWARTYNAIRRRCNKGAYKKRGIQKLITLKELKFLWIRDQAHLLIKPSIDRIDTYGNYSLENCRYIELSENLKRPKVVFIRKVRKSKSGICIECNVHYLRDSIRGMCKSCYKKLQKRGLFSKTSRPVPVETCAK